MELWDNKKLRYQIRFLFMEHDCFVMVAFNNKFLEERKEILLIDKRKKNYLLL